MAIDRTIAVLGAGGTMGLPMCRNLARAGATVRAWNRTREKAASLTGDGVAVCDTAAEAAAGADVVLTILSDADAVLGAAEPALAAAPDGVVWLQMSTIGIAGTERCDALAQRLGARLVDSPVLGTKQPAEEGKLVVLASGPEDLREPLAPILDAVGQRTLWVGDAGAGNRLKLVVNTWLLAIVEGAAESLALAEGLDLDPALLMEAVAGGGLDLPYLRLKGQAMIERRFEPSFKLALAAKDAGLVQDAAERHELDLPLVRTIRERLDAATGEHGELDLAVTFLTSAP